MFGAVILMVSNILVKLIGAFFKIPLTNLIGTEGMAYFQAAYSIYVSFYMISTAGIPVAISRMIAASNSRGNVKEVNKIFKISFWVFFVVGIAGMAIMMGMSKQFASAAKLDDSVFAMLAIAPTLFFICLSSAYRGYFQGLQNMIPTAVSQVIESCGKLLIGLIAGKYFLSKGYPIHIVAAYVISGVTIGVVAATVYIMIFKRMFGAAKAESESVEIPVRTTGDLLFELVVISIPISLASSIMGLTNVVDTMLVARRLTESGIASEVAIKSYGAYTSMSITLFNMPTTLIYPFAISALPALSKYYATKEDDKAKALMDSTFRVSSIVAFPCAFGLSAMAHPIISLLYKNESIAEGVSNIDIAADCLGILGIAVFFLGMISVTNSILQAYHFQNYTIASTVCGIIVKSVATYILLGIKSVGIVGAAVGTALCYMTIMLMNTLFIIIKIGYFPKLSKTFVRPLLSGVACVVACLLVYNMTFGIMGNTLSAIASIATAAVVYLAAILLLRAFREEDIKMLPKSELILKVLRKAKLI